MILCVQFSLYRQTLILINKKKSYLRAGPGSTCLLPQCLGGKGNRSLWVPGQPRLHSEMLLMKPTKQQPQYKAPKTPRNKIPSIFSKHKGHSVVFQCTFLEAQIQQTVLKLLCPRSAGVWWAYTSYSDNRFIITSHCNSFSLLSPDNSML